MNVFGEPVLYPPTFGSVSPLTGVFDQAYREQFPMDALMPGNVSNTRPVLGVRISQFTAAAAALPVQGDSLTIVRTGASYTVSEVRIDSHGWALLLLNEAA